MSLFEYQEIQLNFLVKLHTEIEFTIVKMMNEILIFNTKLKYPVVVVHIKCFWSFMILNW